ncbi:MAG: XRE family transcriptional regulator, partial [Clostridia bacterium]|nr:XRE family transcriptional regulator [Clostridia bacterium]
NFKLDNKVLYENISNFIEKRAESTFVENLLRLILQSGKKDSRVYKDAGVDRRLFSKMISNYNYRPSKDTVLAFALSLELNLEQSKELLSSAGYSLSNSDKRDVILTFCFERGIYKMKQVNEILYVFREKTF